MAPDSFCQDSGIHIQTPVMMPAKIG